MLHNELSAHQHDHAEQGRAQHQLGVPEGLEQLTGQEIGRASCRERV